MSDSLIQIKNENDLTAYYKQQEENHQEVLKKIELLKNFRPQNGLRILGYPSGISYGVLQRVCELLKNVEDFDLLISVSLPPIKNNVFTLARNGSMDQIEIERIQKQQGGIHSEDVYDFGDIRIALFKKKEGEDDKPKILISAFDYSFYRIKESIAV